CGACQDTGEVLADSHLKAREMIVDVDYPTRGTYQTVGCPIKLSDSPVAVSRPPLLGEHTDVLLESLCGVEPDEAKRLRQEGVVSRGVTFPAGCCALAARGHAAAAPPSTVMNWRRFIRSPRRRGQAPSAGWAKVDDSPIVGVAGPQIPCRRCA